MIWRDRLPKAPLDPQAVVAKTGVQDVYDWIRLFNGFQAELPEPFSIIDVLEGDGCDLACQALRALRRNPNVVRCALIDMRNNRIWNVNPVLHKLMEMMNPSFAIDLGCGAGRDAVWLAANGWEVTAVDRLEGNIDTLRKLRLAYAPEDPVHWTLGNLNEYQLERQYNLVLLHYCWDPNYFELAKRATAPGGYLSILALSEKNYQCFAHPRDSKVIHPSTLNTEGFDIVLSEEKWAIDRHFVSIVLQRR